MHGIFGRNRVGDILNLCFVKNVFALNFTNHNNCNMKYKQTINLMGGVFFAFVGGTLSYYVVYDWVKQGIGDAKLSVLIVAGALGLAMLFNGLNWLVRQIKSRYDAAILNAIDYP